MAGGGSNDDQGASAPSHLTQTVRAGVVEGDEEGLHGYTFKQVFTEILLSTSCTNTSEQDTAPVSFIDFTILWGEGEIRDRQSLKQTNTYIITSCEKCPEGKQQSTTRESNRVGWTDLGFRLESHERPKTWRMSNQAVKVIRVNGFTYRKKGRRI